MNVRRLVLGGVLLALGVLVGVVGLAWVLRGFFAMDASVVADGQSHAVEVGAGEHFVWVDASTRDPDCTVESAGTPLPLNPVSGEFTRSSGSVGPWVARWWFDSPTDVVTVVCDGAPRFDPGSIDIGPRMKVGDLLVSLVAVVGLAAVLGLAGVVLLVMAVVRGVTPQSAPATT